MMRLAETALRGSYPPLVTPFRDGRVDLETFASLVDRQVRLGSHGIVVCGTTGEPSSLTLSERADLVRMRGLAAQLAKKLEQAEADFSEHFAKGAFMQRFAVHNDAVHVKNDGRKLFHFKWLSGAERQ